MSIQPYSFIPENQCYALPERDFERIQQAANALLELAVLVGEMQLSKGTLSPDRLASLLHYPADDLNQVCDAFSGE